MSALGFSEAWLQAEVWPRFSRVRQRDEIYLANHSLGRPPDRMAEDLRAAVDVWYRDLDRAWSHWTDAREHFRTLVARLIHAPSPDCVVPKASAGQGLRAVINALPGKPRVLTSDEEFDSLDFILRVFRDKGRIALKVLPFDDFTFQASDLIVVSTVAFRTAKILQGLAEIVARAHAGHALVLLDVYHHAGALPLDVSALDVDFAVGGSYKYLRGGPGASWLYVHPRHHHLTTLDTGWFAKRDVFAYARPEPPAFGAGGDAWLESTPSVLAPVQALAGLALTLELGVERLRAHGLAQKARLTSLLRERGVFVAGSGTQHGAFLTLQRDDALTLSARLRAHRVNTDARGDVLRLGPDLLNGDAELVRAANVLQTQVALRPGSVVPDDDGGI